MSAAVPTITGPTQQGVQLLKQPLAAVSQRKTMFMLTDVRTAYAQHTF
jgi:hypothetical protein